jgi:hypothetical protein
MSVLILPPFEPVTSLLEYQVLSAFAEIGPPAQELLFQVLSAQLPGPRRFFEPEEQRQFS